jgi:hypothetical protein
MALNRGHFFVQSSEPGDHSLAYAAARSSFSAPRITVFSASSDNGRCNAFASSHGARIQTFRSSSVVMITKPSTAASHGWRGFVKAPTASFVARHPLARAVPGQRSGLAIGDETARRQDLWSDLVTALENYANAREDGSLNYQIVRAFAEAINASR